MAANKTRTPHRDVGKNKNKTKPSSFSPSCWRSSQQERRLPARQNASNARHGGTSGGTPNINHETREILESPVLPCSFSFFWREASEAGSFGSQGRRLSSFPRRRESGATVSWLHPKKRATSGMRRMRFGTLLQITHACDLAGTVRAGTLGGHVSWHPPKEFIRPHLKKIQGIDSPETQQQIVDCTWTESLQLLPSAVAFAYWNPSTIFDILHACI